MTASFMDCPDCGSKLSRSAARCPQCGSTELHGPLRLGRRAPRMIGIEGKNDRTLVVCSLVLGAIGACYGYAVSAGAFSAILWAPLYGLLGLMIGVPLAFAINLMRG